MGFFDSLRSQLAVQKAHAEDTGTASGAGGMSRGPVAMRVDSASVGGHRAPGRVDVVLSEQPVGASVGAGGAQFTGGAAARVHERRDAQAAGAVIERIEPSVNAGRDPAKADGVTALTPHVAPPAGQRRSNPLQDAPIEQDVTVDLSEVQILSAEGQFAANIEQRKLLCFLSDGRLLVAAGPERYSAYVLSYIALLERNSVRHVPVQTRQTKIVALYESAGFSTADGNRKSAQSTKAKSTAEGIIADATKLGASDIHLEVLHDHALLDYRVDGDLERMRELAPDFGLQLIRTFYQVLADISGETFKENEKLDARIGKGKHLPSGLDGVRIATTPTAEGNKLVMRLLYSMVGESVDLSNLGFAQSHIDLVEELKELPIGLNIISGPTGSGKSTTLQRTLRGFIEQTKGTKHVITVEDPPEYPIPGAVQTPVGNSSTQTERTELFTAAIGSAMRLDPDLIMVGEVRDLPSAELVLRAATTGHQVWTTLHANNALHNIDRLVNMGMDKDMLLDHTVLTGLVSQRLIRRLCPHCKTPLVKVAHGFDKRRIERLMTVFGDRFDQVHVAGGGCQHCRGGTKGRTVAVEVVRPTAQLCDLLRQGDRIGAREHWLLDLKGQTFMQHAINKIGQGEIDPFAAMRVLGPLVLDRETLKTSTHKASNA